EGTPPFRALVVDYPDDPEVWRLDKQYMMGDNIMCAPFIEGVSEREVYFPKGIWYDFNTNKKYEGGKKYTIQMTLDQIPMFIKEGTILPLAKPVEFITPETVFEVNCKVYGKPANDMRLFEDDGFTFNFEKGNYNWLDLSWNGKKGLVKRSGNFRKKLFNISAWEKID
ncbi:MAG: glycoside hydrolase family 31 protein, partial [Bacteroidota bacterium]|nr:glycoside hydrolase family 31 protein [Bacteroidota bacterium]